MYRSIRIEKLDVKTEEWEPYFKGFAKVNKSSGREYYNAKTNITENTYNFKTHYIDKLKNIQFNTSEYRIIYQNHIFDIINVDDKEEKHLKLTLVAECKTLRG